jgi:ribonuclease T1
MLCGANNKKTGALAACVLLIASLVSTVTVHARQPANAEGQPTVRLAELPSTGRDTYQRILAGGPFTYEKDGVVFGNRERLLPPRQRGYYREYTVKTPGQRNRGAQRIVCGGARPTAPEGCFYTNDHYASFRRIVE